MDKHYVRFLEDLVQIAIVSPAEEGIPDRITIGIRGDPDCGRKQTKC